MKLILRAHLPNVTTLSGVRGPTGAAAELPFVRDELSVSTLVSLVSNASDVYNLC